MNPGIWLVQGTPGDTQTTVIVLNVTFFWWFSRCKKLKTSIGSFQFYCWSKNAKNQTNQLILSRDTDHQRILQSDWMRDTTGHTRPKLIVSDVAKNSKIPPDSLQEIMMVNESCNLIGQEVQVATPNQNW